MTQTPLTDAERASLQRALRYAAAIFAAIALTLVIVAVASTALQG